MMHIRLVLALTLLVSVSLRAGLTDFFNPQDAMGRAHLTTACSLVGGAAAYSILMNFSNLMPKVGPLGPSLVVKLVAAVAPGILIADYNADGKLDFSVLKGLQFWSGPSLKEAGASLQALVSLAGFANIAAGYLGASVAEYYMNSSAHPVQPAQLAQDTADKVSAAAKKEVVAKK